MITEPMTPTQALNHLRSRGYHLRVKPDGKLGVMPKPTGEDEGVIIANRDALIAVLVSICPHCNAPLRSFSDDTNDGERCPVDPVHYLDSWPNGKAYTPGECDSCHRKTAVRKGQCEPCWNSIAETFRLAQLNIFTAGYGRRDFADFNARVLELDAMVYDIRLNPWSERDEWKKANLQRALGERYRHLASLGNKNHKQRELGIEIADVNSGVDEILKHDQSSILLCGCAERLRCHRLNVGYAIERRGCTVKELEW